MLLNPIEIAAADASFVWLLLLAWQGAVEERQGAEAGTAALARSCKSHAT